MFNFLRPRVTPPDPDLPIAFGPNCAWFAIRSASVLEVALALRLRRTEPANWAGGLERAYAGDVFVSPTVGSWVLAISTRLPEVSQPPGRQRLAQWLTRLSQRFGEAQYFATQRETGFHAWAKARQGQIVRAHAYSANAGMLWNDRPETPEEIALRVHWSVEPSPDVDIYAAEPRTDLPLPTDEASVLAIARKWSVDTSFSGGPYTPGVGVAGDFRA